MSSLEIGEDHHVARYCKPSAIGDDGLPLATAFELRDRDDHLSVNWLEFFETTDLPQAIDYVRQAFREKKFGVRRNGKFVSLQVGMVKEVILRNSDLPAKIIHLPEQNDPSHSGVFGYTASDELISTEISELVHAEDIHPGKSP
ncbi:MAG: hypothetical protein F4065_08815 [Rhodothermaceae bacterium]|nr:hypothetical protein [Rhodothermaceae bacterium]MXZ58871.1 hypothetical protein [Rhodothermaceae bacterium]MYB89995.1 hypothetical protein [Rhodothermaceae bacterium]MYD68441.1 hypothetical protein [Rhodothermaceae bacterium]MYG43736.1 hypothetical protein [Rhodothermaceae bacterium]